MTFDYIIVGGGIVGLSTALQLQERHPDHRILLLEKEEALGLHQSGHNSGVIHSGIYYPPGSFKARFCKAGAAALKDYCRRRGIEYREPGKLIVASSDDEVARLRKLKELSGEHRIAAEWLAERDIGTLEPAIRGLAALRIPSSGIVDYRAVLQAFATDFRERGGQIETGVEVRALNEDSQGIQVVGTRSDFRGRFLLACAGLQSDRLAQSLGIATDFRIVPVRGEYFQLPPERHGLVRHMIYPVPKPGLPFLGVHITPLVDGRITVGPNAVFAGERESYLHPQSRGERWRDWRDSLLFPGFWRMGLEHWRFALGEALNSRFRARYLDQLRRYCPSLELRDLQEYPPGVRAQAVGRDGRLIHDFLFAESPRSLHVCNAPSPAATSALPIGAHLCDKLESSGRI